jgi:hypothetical protein
VETVGLEKPDGLETRRWNGTKSAFADWGRCLDAIPVLLQS